MRSHSVDRRRQPLWQRAHHNFRRCDRSAAMSVRISHLSKRTGLLAQVLECHLDAIVVELLVISSELVPAARPAVEELTDDPDGRVRLTLKCRRAPYVDGAV